MRRYNPRGSIPTILVDEDVMVGFNPSRLAQMYARAIKRRAQKLLGQGTGRRKP